MQQLHDRLRPQRLGCAYRRHIERLFQRAPYRHRPMKLFIVVLRRPRTSLRFKGDRFVRQQTRRGQLANLTLAGRFQCGKIDEGFEERTRLPSCLNRTVELTPPVVSAPHQRQHRSGLGIEHHDRPLHDRFQ